jgi:hypothetical protein
MAETMQLKQFQQKCAAVLRPEMREGKKQFQQKCVAVLSPELRKGKKTIRTTAVMLCAIALFSGASLWPPLPSKGFLTDRAAEPQDVDNGMAIFATGEEGHATGRPIAIKIPQYGYFREEKKYVIILQAEEYDGKSVIGAETFDGDQVVGFMDDFELLGVHAR